jgi:hypothetical protein
MSIGRRLPIVVVLIALLVAAIAVGERVVTADAGVREAPVAASMPASNVRSSAWYCSGGPVGDHPSGDRVTISNLGPRRVRVAVDVMVTGHAVTERFVTVAARSSLTLSVAQLSKAPEAAIVVQPLGGNVVVAQGYSVSGDVAMVPCATRAATSWYFASGSSLQGTQHWLLVLNPFAVDAVVDVEAYTEDGLRAPGSLQGLVVARNSRLPLRIDRAVSEQKIVAVSVHTRNGARVVATQALTRPRGKQFDTSLSLGALTPAHTWMFADNRSRSGAVQQLVIAAPGDQDAIARVSVVADVAARIEPRVVRVPATAALTVDFSGAIPSGVSYTLVVHSVVPIIAETRDSYVNDYSGLITEVGTRAASARWAFAGGPITATGLGGGRARVPNGYDMSVVMKVDATDKQLNDVYAALATNGHVTRARKVSRDDALKFFRTVNRNNPALIEHTTSAMVPPSVDVEVQGSDLIEPIKNFVSQRPGVERVVTVATQGARYTDDIVVFNPGHRAVRVSLTATAAGSRLTGAGMTSITIAPGRQATISLALLTQKGVAVALAATGPVVAERFTAGPWGVTRAPGVPAP